jgi:hypothetical protein
MKSYPVRGTGEKRKRCYATFYQQWSGLIGSHNWYDFTLVHVTGEFDPSTGRWECELGLLGLNLTLTYVYDHTFNDYMDAQVEHYTKHPEELKSWPSKGC